MRKYIEEAVPKFMAAFLFLLVVRCPELSSPNNGTISSNRTEFRTNVCFTCSEGYDLIGDTCLNCTSNGTWSNSKPHCSGTLQELVLYSLLSLTSFLAVYCMKLRVPSNGSSSTNDTVFGTQVEFNCDVGFQLNGLQELTCFPNGSWSGDEPWCNGNA